MFSTWKSLSRKDNSSCNNNDNNSGKLLLSLQLLQQQSANQAASQPANKQAMYEVVLTPNDLPLIWIALGANNTCYCICCIIEGDAWNYCCHICCSSLLQLLPAIQKHFHACMCRFPLQPGLLFHILSAGYQEYSIKIFSRSSFIWTSTTSNAIHTNVIYQFM